MAGATPLPVSSKSVLYSNTRDIQILQINPSSMPAYSSAYKIKKHKFIFVCIAICNLFHVNGNEFIKLFVFAAI